MGEFRHPQQGIFYPPRPHKPSAVSAPLAGYWTMLRLRSGSIHCIQQSILIFQGHVTPLQIYRAASIITNALKVKSEVAK
jgi:hypothetical protein